MRGRKPKSVEQRRLEGGDVSHRPLPEPLLIAGRPDLQDLAEPNEGLGVAGREFWRATVLHVVKTGMVDLVDRPALEVLARTWDEYSKADAVVASEGFFTSGTSGQIREHPALKIRARARADFFKFAEQFGLTPMARTRFGLMDLHRRSLSSELDKHLGSADVIGDADVVEEGDVVGLPGL